MTSISAISSSISTSYITQSQSSDTLSEETKAKLIALGIDPSTVSSESEAQSLIAQAEAAEQMAEQTNEQTSSLNSEQDLISKAQELADKVGVSVSQTDSLDEMCGKISEKIENLMEQCGTDAAKLSTLQGYSQELANINAQYTQVQTNQQSMFTAMNMISVSNKYALGLS